MRFDKSRRAEPFAWTPRKAAAAVSKPARELARLQQTHPLLAGVLPVRSAAVDLALEAEQRQASWARTEASLRALDARCWREARRDYFAAPDDQRAQIRAAWLAWRGPATPVYFRYLVDLHTGVVAKRDEARRARDAELRAQIRKQLGEQCSLDLAPPQA